MRCGGRKCGKKATVYFGDEELVIPLCDGCYRTVSKASGLGPDAFEFMPDNPARVFGKGGRSA